MVALHCIDVLTEFAEALASAIVLDRRVNSVGCDEIEIQSELINSYDCVYLIIKIINHHLTLLETVRE